jgi:hypothetical protein
MHWAEATVLKEQVWRSGHEKQQGCLIGPVLSARQL